MNTHTRTHSYHTTLHFIGQNTIPCISKIWGFGKLGNPGFILEGMVFTNLHVRQLATVSVGTLLIQVCYFYPMLFMFQSLHSENTAGKSHVVTCSLSKLAL